MNKTDPPSLMLEDNTTETPPHKGVKRRLSRRTWIGIGTVAVIALFVFGARWLLYGRYMETTNNAYVQSDEIVVAPKVTGYVSHVYVAENQKVAAGDVLVAVDSRDYDAAVTRLLAERLAADAAVEGAKDALREHEAQSELAEAQVRAAKVAVGYAKSNAERYRALSASGAETTERYDNSRFDADRASAELDIRKASLNAVKLKVPILERQLMQLISQRDAVSAQVAKAQHDLDDTKIRTGIDGVVGSRTVREGQFVQPGQRLMTVVPVSSFYITANFKETQLSHMRVGQDVSVKVDAFPDQEFLGKVESFAPATGAEFSILKPENATGNFTKIVQRVPVRIQLEQSPPTSLLKAGLSVSVTVDTRRKAGTD